MILITFIFNFFTVVCANSQFVYVLNIKTVFRSKTDHLRTWIRFLAKNMLTYIKLVLTHISTALYINVTKLQTQHTNSSHWYSSGR